MLWTAMGELNTQDTRFSQYAWSSEKKDKYGVIFKRDQEIGKWETF